MDKLDCLVRSRKIAKRLNRSGINHFYGADFYCQLLAKYILQ